MAPVTPINELYVLSYTIEAQKDQGYSDYEIALIHNGGSIKEKKGINSHGQKYDTKAYALDVMNILSTKAYAK